MEQEERKNKRKSIAEWIAVFLCIAATPVPCITVMSTTIELAKQCRLFFGLAKFWNNLQGSKE